jgi:hypothetical protein
MRWTDISKPWHKDHGCTEKKMGHSSMIRSGISRIPCLAAMMTMRLCLPNERSALDVQAMSKEREDRLQLVEYELRLAKEDLAAMQKRLEQVLGRGV